MEGLGEEAVTQVQRCGAGALAALGEFREGLRGTRPLRVEGGGGNGDRTILMSKERSSVQKARKLGLLISECAGEDDCGSNPGTYK